MGAGVAYEGLNKTLDLGMLPQIPLVLDVRFDLELVEERLLLICEGSRIILFCSSTFIRCLNISDYV